ncbi:MAG TPA: metalloregulator ArsR/SmtB family transcription factor [Gemmatimonadaceae bacterium]|nr:metalloregulator ArsR/SmtB family transcription factor [Gemmatimonadaceae bacterium]
MSKRHNSGSGAGPKSSAPLFAALGDTTRLRLVTRLCNTGPMSIASLTAGSKVTRQAITKHLRIMEEAGLLLSTRQGRESIWELDQQRIQEARRYLKMISRQWDDAIDRLKDLVES